MNKKRIFSLQLLLCAALSVQQVRSFVTATSATTFTGNSTAAAFHKPSGKWFIGKITHADDTRLLISAGAVNGTDTETLTTIDTDTNAGRSVSLLALSEQPSDANNVRCVFVKSNTPTALNVVNSDGTNDALVAAADIDDAAGATNAGIVALTATSYKTAATENYAFLAVSVNGGTFPATNSGIASVSLEDAAASAPAYVTTLKVDATIAEVKSDSGANADPILIAAHIPALHWNSDLERLYIGLQGTSSAAVVDEAESLKVLIICSNDNGTLTKIPLFNASNSAALLAGTSAAASNIVGLSNTPEISYSILKLDSMKTSTGHNYLIINGGLGLVGGAPSRSVFAIPLVDTDGDVPGTLAAVTPATGITTFKKQATVNTQLFTETSTPARVGGAALPVTAAAGVVTQMMVVGDTVYCATQSTLGATSRPGLHYSQAIFNADGSISGWTNWALAVPNQVSGLDAADGSCFAFAVDAITGKIWTIANEAKTAVRVTQWVRDTEAATFGGSVNALLSGPCYSSLNLGQHTVNFGALNINRFAFFGGDSKVVVVKTGATGTAGYTAVETATNDWAATTVKATDISTGLEGVGPITALAWTNQNDGAADNYLLAGTNKGLFAYVSTAADAGITIATDLPDDVNEAPFNTYEWKAVTGITDPVVKIISTTVDTDPYTFILTHGAQHKLWRIDADGKATLTTLNAAVELVWTADAISANGDAPAFFYDIELVGTDGANSLLVIATDKGIYQVANTAIALADFKDATNLYRLDLNAETDEIRSFASPLRTRLNQNVDYARSMIRLNSNGKWARVKSALGSMIFSQDGSDYAQVLSGDTLADDNSSLAIANPIKKFYSDGARRFYIEAQDSNVNGNHTLHILPFYNGSDDYNVSEVADLADKAIAESKTFYWVNEMGAGYLMAGTNDGVVTLR